MRKKDSITSDLGFISAIDQSYPYKLIVKSIVSGENGCIIFQTRGMKKVLLAKEHANQTDTIMGYVKEKSLPSANVTTTTVMVGM